MVGNSKGRIGRAVVVTVVLLASVAAAPLQSDRNIRVKFPRGRTSTVIRDAVIRATRDNYILGARAGQTMSVHITSLEKNAEFDILPPGGGEPLAREAMDWSGELPEGGDYVVSVGPTRGNASYTLKLSIR